MGSVRASPSPWAATSADGCSGRFATGRLTSTRGRAAAFRGHGWRRASSAPAGQDHPHRARRAPRSSSAISEACPSVGPLPSGTPSSEAQTPSFSTAHAACFDLVLADLGCPRRQRPGSTGGAADQGCTGSRETDRDVAGQHLEPAGATASERVGREPRSGTNETPCRCSSDGFVEQLPALVVPGHRQIVVSADGHAWPRPGAVLVRAARSPRRSAAVMSTSWAPGPCAGRSLAVDRSTRRLCGQGRRYSVQLLLASQQPVELPENVLVQCDNPLLMRVNSARDREPDGAAGEFVGDPTPGVGGLRVVRRGRCGLIRPRVSSPGREAGGCGALMPSVDGDGAGRPGPVRDEQPIVGVEVPTYL